MFGCNKPSMCSLFLCGFHAAKRNWFHKWNRLTSSCSLCDCEESGQIMQIKALKHVQNMCFSLHKVLHPLSTCTRCCYLEDIHSFNASLHGWSSTKKTVRENNALVNANSRETSQLIALLRCYLPDFNALSTCPLHAQAIDHLMSCAI